MRAMPVDLEVHADDAGQRVDRFLRKLLPRAPLSLVHRLLRQGTVRVDGRKVDGAFRLSSGSRLELRVDDERFASMTDAAEPEGPARTLPVKVVFEDDDVLVVDKPGGLAVHGGTGVNADHLVARVRARLGDGGSHTFRPAPAHRIDRATSGLVVIGKTAAALREMTAMFGDHLVEKVYLAVVHGRPHPRDGTIDRPLAVKDDGDGDPAAAKTEVDADGRTAITHYRTRRSRQHLSLVEVRIDTGRTHQVRAHLASIGCPIVGDRRYGAPDRPALGGHRIALHAARLKFPHPGDGHEVKVRAATPREFDALLDQRAKAPATTDSARRRRRRP